MASPFPVIKAQSEGPAATPAAAPPQTTTAWKRPTGLVIFILIWLAVAFYVLYISFNLYGPENSSTLHLGAASTYSIVVQDLTLRIVLQLIAIVQIVTSYWLWRGSPFAYIAGLGVPACLLWTFGSLTAAYWFAPVRVGLRTPMLFGTLGLIAAFTVASWVYLSRPRIKRYLTRWI